MAPAVSLTTFTRQHLGIVQPWFCDADTQRFVGGPDWPASMLELGDRLVGQPFRGAVQTGAYRYLAHADGRPFGYIDCGTFDRCTECGGEGADGPIITGAIEVATGAIAFVVDPHARRRGLGTRMITSLLREPQLRFVELFEAGVEPENTASRRCLQDAGFRLRSARPDVEGMLYYRATRSPGEWA